MANSKKRRKTLIFTGIGFVLVTLILVAVFKKREPLISVVTEKVMRTNITETVKANGKLQPVIQVVISPEVSGEIIELPVKEGQHVNKGDLLLKIKPDFYIAAVNQAKAGYESALAGRAQAQAGLIKAEAEFNRNKQLFNQKLVSESDYIGFKSAYDVAVAQLESAVHQVENAKAMVASAEDSLSKTTIASPLSGTISKLNSQLGERVLGTVQNVGTEIMTIADLNDMEARVDIGEMDVVLIKPGQKAHLEVDAFKDRKFSGTVTQVANSSEGLYSRATAASSSSTPQEATKFEVRIYIAEKEFFRPGMSVTAEVETRYRTNVLAVPLAAVTTRLPKPQDKSPKTPAAAADPAGSNTVAAADPPAPGSVPAVKPRESKPIEVVFVVDGNHAKMVPVKRGIGDDNYWEITDGLSDGQEIISGGYRAVGRDLEDGKKIKKGGAAEEPPKNP